MAIATGTAILAGAGLAAGAGLISGYMGSKAAGSAAETQAGAANAATEVQREMFYQNREDLAPWREAGKKALNTLTSLIEKGPGEYTKSPGYEFRLGEGAKTIERGAAARGNLLSGGTQKALARYGQDYAMQDYDNWLRRYYESLTPYQSMAGVGQSTASQTAAMGTQAARDIGQNMLAAGNAQAQGRLNASNAWQSGMINLSNVANRGIENYLAWKYSPFSN